MSVQVGARTLQFGGVSLALAIALSCSPQSGEGAKGAGGRHAGAGLDGSTAPGGVSSGGATDGGTRWSGGSGGASRGLGGSAAGTSSGGETVTTGGGVAGAGTDHHKAGGSFCSDGGSTRGGAGGALSAGVTSANDGGSTGPGGGASSGGMTRGDGGSASTFGGASGAEGELSAGAAGANDGGSAGASDGGVSSGGAEQVGCRVRGSHCDLSSDCAKGYYCVDWECKIGSDLNEPCVDGCRQGLACLSGKCVVPAALNSPCPSWYPCVDGAICEYVRHFNCPISSPCLMCIPASGMPYDWCMSDDTCGPDQYCAARGGGGLPTNFRCEPRVAENLPCPNSREACQPGLYCSTATSTPMCRRIPQAGEPCRQAATGTRCAVGMICDSLSQLCKYPGDGDPCSSGACPAALYCDGSLCRTKLELGVPCSPGRCQSDLYCPAPTTCVRSGSFCSDDSDCDPYFHCVGNSCMPPAVLNAPCGYGCAAGLRCSVYGYCESIPSHPAGDADAPGACVSQGCPDGTTCRPSDDVRCAQGDLCFFCSVPSADLSYCREDRECGADGRCADSSCQPGRLSGEFCVPDTERRFLCRLDNYCSADFQCAPRPILGESCAFAAAICAVGYCNPATKLCTAYPAPGEPCFADQCREGSFCDRGLCRARAGLSELCSPGQSMACVEGLTCPPIPSH